MVVFPFDMSALRHVPVPESPHHITQDTTTPPSHHDSFPFASWRIKQRPLKKGPRLRKGRKKIAGQTWQQRGKRQLGALRRILGEPQLGFHFHDGSSRLTSHRKLRRRSGTHYSNYRLSSNVSAGLPARSRSPQEPLIPSRPHQHP